MALSNYPPGYGFGPITFEAQMRCPDCGTRWDATGTEELGGAWLDDDGELCVECGADGDIIKMY